MDFCELEQKVREYKSIGKRLFTTCSFQSHSLVLLHMLSRIDRSLPVYFINTGFHFPETIRFREEVARAFGVHVIDLMADVPKFLQRDHEGRLLYVSDPDHCCALNKVQPVDALLRSYDVWINGIRAGQSEVRAHMQLEEQAPHGCLRFHPMLAWSSKMIYEYQQEWNLPKHPLEEQGYVSIGCEPCTRRIDAGGDSRGGRWCGLKKLECGLHTELVVK